jgi:hypothetical protein
MGAVDTGNFLRGNDIGHIVHLLTAVLLRYKDPEQPQFCHFLHGLIGKLLFVIQLAGDRFDFVFGEPAD